MASKKNSNPVVETYRGVPVRKYPRVYLRISIYEMKRFIDAEIDFNMSAKEAIKNKDILCHTSTGIEIKKYG